VLNRKFFNQIMFLQSNQTVAYGLIDENRTARATWSTGDFYTEGAFIGVEVE